MAATDTMHGDPVATEGDDGQPATGSEATPVVPRSQSFASELLRAMHVAAMQNRDAMMEHFRSGASQFLDGIKERSAVEANELRRTADEDLTSIREWSKAEIARIKSEADGRVADRRAELDRQLEQQDTLIEREIQKVSARIGAFEEQVAAFFGGLEQETDPSAFASTAQRMPEPPDLQTTAADARAEAIRELATGTGPEATAEPVLEEAQATPEDSREAAEPGETAAPAETPEAHSESVEAAADTPEPATPSWETPRAWDPSPSPVDENAGGSFGGTPSESVGYGAEEPAIITANETGGDGEPSAADTRPMPGNAPEGGGGWSTAVDPRLVSLGMMPGNGYVGDAATDDPAWQPASPAPDASPESSAPRSFEAPSGSDSFGQPSGWSDQPMTTSTEPASDSEPALIEHDPAARLAGLVPSSEHPATARIAEPVHAAAPVDVVPTQVVVTGLVSVASIASFKRHLARIPGVQSVGVSSGPEGEFIFKATHEPHVALRDVVPSLPGFGARVVNATDGALHVTARDPEADA